MKKKQQDNLRLGEEAANQQHYAIAIDYFKCVPKESAEHYLLALLGLAYCYYRQHKHIDHYWTLKEISQLKTLDIIQINEMANSMTQIRFINEFESALHDMDFLFQQNLADKRLLAGSCARLLVSYYHEWHQHNNDNHHKNLYHDHFFWGFFSKTLLPALELDQLLVKVRRNLLLSALSQEQLNDDEFVVCKAIAAQGLLSEYVAYQAADEREMLEGLITVVKLQTQTDAWKPNDIEGILWLIAMYQSFAQLDCAESLAVQTLSHWSMDMQPLIKNSLRHFLEDIHRAKNITALNNIHQQTPEQVREQYEQNPYPQWDTAHFVSLGSIGAYIQYLHPSLILPVDFFNKKPRVLIAGCGTGVQAITSAQQMPEATIVAIDISRRSLAYAQRKAEEHGCHHIQFYQADILSLDETLGDFDYIECCGVLHHLCDPLAGWQQLLARLKPSGLMRIDLYSRYARQEITQRKNQIAQLFPQSPTAIQMRNFRQALIEQGQDKQLMSFRDFYNFSEFRDLLFHTQETQYDWLEIEKILSELHLNLVAMHALPKKQQIFRRELPNGNMQSFADWYQVELKNPSLFYDMYSFWCTRK